MSRQQVIAHGAAASVKNLPPGHRILTLQVKGDSGPGAKIAAVTVKAGGKSVSIKARHSGVLRVPVKPGHGYVVITMTAYALRNQYTFTRAVQRA